MIKTFKLLSTLALTLISINIYAETETTKPTAPAPDPIPALLQTSISSLVEKNNIPGVAVELYVDGKPYEYYTGYADKENKDPVIKKTIFELGSISKLMTCILLAQEIDWAKMSLSDPITKYVKDLPESFNKIKLQDLATHTSGLPFNAPINIGTQDELKTYLSQWSGAEPGEEWIYSNVGIGMLGYALENSTESEFSDLYRRHILNPLKMVSGVMVPNTLAKYYAQGYDTHGNMTSHYNPGFMPSAGAIKASASDMQKFLSAAIGLPDTPPRVFYPIKLTQSVFVKVNDDYQGLGWQIHRMERRDIPVLLNVTDKVDMGPMDVQEVYARPVYNGDAMMDKTGTTNGFRAYIAVIPNKKSGIVILANKNVPNSAIVKTAREILFKTTKLVG